ncbi:uncharacterized protein LOC127714106 [Mytilus californianus]|uniref:uncharacterized protein LOC127714106 n=1 Tax=Mytilus californianus TaxID=6549 RepID=UPI0022464A59|nr:uncharacterized protein LOC127714106 [Mytilus californianus]
MSFTMLYGCAIFLFTISLNKNVLANSCENDNCKAAIDIPLITKLNAPLKAELDISGLTTQLKELIAHEVKHAVSVAMTDLVEDIVDKRVKAAQESLQTAYNHTISTFQQKTQLALMSYLPGGDQQITGILKFSDVKFSVGITNLSAYKSTGKFECEMSGIYLVSASIVGTTKGVDLNINLNGNIISYTRISEGNWQTGTAVLAVQLLNNDKLWVEVGNMKLSGNKFAVFSIIKIL